MLTNAGNQSMNSIADGNSFMDKDMSIDDDAMDVDVRNHANNFNNFQTGSESANQFNFAEAGGLNLVPFPEGSSTSAFTLGGGSST